MKERKKPTQSWIGRSIEEIEKEAFKKGWEAGFVDACEITHKFAEMVYRMRWAQSDEQAAIDNSDQDNAHRYGLIAKGYEDEVDTWIQENYPHLMEG